VSIPPRIFLDTTIHKHGIRSRDFLRRSHDSITWQLVAEDPVDVRGVASGTRAEIDLLAEVARLARVGQIQLVTHLEAVWELAGNLLLGPRQSIFGGIPVEHVGNPIPYSRRLTPFLGEGETVRSLTAAFLASLRDPRYLEIRRACGAFQGDRPSPPNQMMDAFLIWCADVAQVPYFLTTDLKLVRTVRLCKSVALSTRVVSPSQLMDALEERRSP